jgi:hypothetical protein
VERNPLKPVAVHIFDQATGRAELDLPAISAVRPDGTDLLRVWRDDRGAEAEAAVVKATIALGLLALGAAAAGQADAHAAELWSRRHGR